MESPLATLAIKPQRPRHQRTSPPKDVSVLCPYCGQPAVFCKTSDHVYRRDFGPVWYCEPCKAWVGTHPDGKPLGRLANAELRKLKIAAHAAFDPLVRGKMRRDGCSLNQARKAGYRWLSIQLGIARTDCHIGMFAEAMCAKVVEVCNIGKDVIL